MASRGLAIQPRYYASELNRGQRHVTDLERASNIPTGSLYRCHMSKIWYDRLPEHKKSAIKPSPEGWKVDEELEGPVNT